MVRKWRLIGYFPILYYTQLEVPLRGPVVSLPDTSILLLRTLSRDRAGGRQRTMTSYAPVDMRVSMAGWLMVPSISHTVQLNRSPSWFSATLLLALSTASASMSVPAQPTHHPTQALSPLKGFVGCDSDE
jgi:hypothetical protein